MPMGFHLSIFTGFYCMSVTVLGPEDIEENQRQDVGISCIYSLMRRGGENI